MWTDTGASGAPRGSDLSPQQDRSISEQRSSLTLQRAPSSPSVTSEAAKPKVSYKANMYTLQHLTFCWELRLCMSHT